MTDFYHSCATAHKSVKEEEAHLLSAMSSLGISQSLYNETLEKVSESAMKSCTHYADAMRSFRLKFLKTGSIEKALKP